MEKKGYKLTVLRGKIELRFNLRLETGMRIGGSDPGIAIGAVDMPIIRDPLSQEPIIPGSSLRGKLRSLLERVLGEYSYKEQYDKRKKRTKIIATHGDCYRTKTGRLFGTSAKEAATVTEEGDKLYPTITRLVARDAKLNRESKEMLKEASRYLDTEFAEVKTEIGVDRLSGGPQSGNLRQVERVPRGAEFECEMVVDVWDVDLDGHNDLKSALGDPNSRVSKMLKLLALGLQLLECDYLGGSGSRGYGKVQVLPKSLRVLEFDPDKLEAEEIKELSSAKGWNPEVFPFSSIVYDQKELSEGKEPKAIEG